MGDGAGTPPRLLTAAEVAAQLGKSERTLRRLLPTAMASHPGLTITRVGRTVMFTPDQLATLIRALEWRSHTANAARSGIVAAPSASVARRLPSASSPQDAVRELTQKLRAQQKKPASGRSILTALPGGRSA